MGNRSRLATIRVIVASLVVTLGVGAAGADALEPRDVVIAEQQAATRNGVSTQAATETPVMGASFLTASQLAAWYRTKGHTPKLPALDNDIRRLAQIFIDEGRADGVRGDIAFVQSAVETGWFTFPDFGQIRPSFNNYAGINAFGGRAKGTTCAAETSPSRCFATPEIGVRTQIHLLRGYADPKVANISGRLKYPPRDRIGVAPLWEDFGYCPPGVLIWAGTCGYGGHVVSIYRNALNYNGVALDCLSASSRTGDEGRGYWVATERGKVSNFGLAKNHGSLTTGETIVDGRTSRRALGYYLITTGGRVHAFGQAPHFGDARRRGLDDVVGMDRTTKGFGYWIATADGRVFEYGGATHHGSVRKLGVVRSDIAGIERSNDGYWVYTSGGTIYSFGDAASFDPLPSTAAGAGPVVSMARTPNGSGAWVLQRNGTVRVRGNAVHFGDLDGCVSRAQQLLPAPDGEGYWILTSSGRVVPFGSAKRLGEPTSLSEAPEALIRF